MRPKRSWLDGRVAVFLDETHRYGFTVPRESVLDLIVDNVASTAAARHVSELAVRREFTDEVSAKWLAPR